MRRVSTRTATVTAVVLLAFGGTVGIAWSYFSTSGTGTGTASTSLAVDDLTVSQANTLTALFPGDSPQAILVDITNNAPNAAYVTSLTTSIAGVTQAVGAVGTCTAADYTLIPSTAVNQDIASGATYQATVGTLQFNNLASNQDGCKGATVNLAFAAV